MGDIRVQRGVTTLPATTESITIPIALFGGDASKAFVRLTSAGPTSAVDKTAQPIVVVSTNYAARITLTDATTLTIDTQPGGTAASKNIAWELWEYVGPVGGPNEFVIRDQGNAPVTSIITNDIQDPFPMFFSRDVFIFSRGGIFSGPLAGNANVPNALNVAGFCLTAFGTNILRFFRGSNDPNHVWNAAYSAVEFIGSNWTAAYTQGNVAFPGFLLQSTLSVDINDWSRTFIWTQKRTQGLNCNDQGMVAIPDPSTSIVLVRYAVEADVRTLFGANSFYTMALNNPFMTVETRSSTIAPGVPFPSSVSAVRQTILEATAGISGPLDEAAVLGSASNDLNFAAFPIGFYAFRVLNSTTIEWTTVDGRFVEDWAQYVIDFSGLPTGDPAITDVAIAIDELTVALEDAQQTVALADSQATVAIADAQATVAVADDQQAVALAAATMTVVVVTEGDDVADFNLCPIGQSMCVSLLNTRPFGWALKDSAGAPVDLSGGGSTGFLFTVNRSENPTTVSDQIVQIPGIITSPGTLGIVTFTPTLLDPTRFNEPGDWYYDVQYTDAAGAIYSILKDQFEIKQTITDPAVLA